MAQSVHQESQRQAESTQQASTSSAVHPGRINSLSPQLMKTMYNLNVITTQFLAYGTDRVKTPAICILSACTMPHNAWIYAYCSMFSSFCRVFFLSCLSYCHTNWKGSEDFFFPFCLLKIGDICLSAEFLLLTLCLPRSPICTSVK